MPDYAIRQAIADDQPQLAALGQECFGYPAADFPHRDPNGDGRTTWVATADDAVVASVVHRRYESWFWGALVPTCGIAGVKVSTEHRGSGLMSRLLQHVLDDARAGGAVLAGLYPSAPALYRPLGFEVITTMDTEVVVPTHVFARVKPGTTTLRRATEADLPGIRDCLDEWARHHNGPLTHRGASFPDRLLLEGSTTVAVDEAGRVTGYACWERHGASQPDSRVEVEELVTTDVEALRSLLASIGTHAMVAPQTVITASADDAMRLVLPSAEWQVRRQDDYMLAVLDVDAALTGRRYPGFVDVETTFSVDDGPTRRLQVKDGAATLETVDGPASTHFSRRGLAVVYAGAQPCAEARRAGLLGPQDDGDEVWDTLFGSRSVQMRDYY